MATLEDESISSLLASMSSALESATQSVPEEANIPVEGLSLFNTKNETFLSYLENLVFLILIKLKHYSAGQEGDSDNSSSSLSLHQTVVEKLAELRLYSDKGIRPLEGRLKYQIDKVVRAADETAGLKGSSKQTVSTINRKQKHRASSVSSSSSIESKASAADHDANNLAYRPNPSALRMTVASQADSRYSRGEQSTGVYKPPKITPTALPVDVNEKGAKSRQKPIKSAAMDDFIANELSTAPVAEPSVGSTIRAGGRSTLTTRQREDNDDRKRYEEDNFVRLPGLTKKEKKARGGEKKKESFGGEEWGGLNASVHRIGRLVASRKGGANALERSRKRLSSGGDFGRDTDKRRKHD